MREKIILPMFFIICATIFVLYQQCIYYPIRAEINNIHSELEKISAIEYELEDFQNLHGDIEDFAALTSQHLYETKKFLPHEIDDDKFIDEIYRLGEKNRISLNAVRIGDISSDDSQKLQKVSINLHMKADYVPLLNFIREIFDGDRLVKLENIYIESNGDFLICSLEISIYAIV